MLGAFLVSSEVPRSADDRATFTYYFAVVCAILLGPPVSYLLEDAGFLFFVVVSGLLGVTFFTRLSEAVSSLYERLLGLDVAASLAIHCSLMVCDSLFSNCSLGRWAALSSLLAGLASRSGPARGGAGLVRARWC